MIRRIAISLMILATIAVGCFLALIRPLLQSEDYTVAVSIDGTPAEAELLRAFPSGPYYVHFENPHLKRERATRYHWFGVVFSRKSVFSPLAIYTSKSGFRYIHADQAKGVSLTDGKIEDNWKVHFTQDGVAFNNAAIRIKLHR